MSDEDTFNPASAIAQWWASQVNRSAPHAGIGLPALTISEEIVEGFREELERLIEARSPRLIVVDYNADEILLAALNASMGDWHRNYHVFANKLATRATTGKVEARQGGDWRTIWRHASLVPVWSITPAESSQYDCEYHRQSEDLEGRRALGRAKDILEAQWEGAAKDDLDITVRIERLDINEEDFPDDDAIPEPPKHNAQNRGDKLYGAQWKPWDPEGEARKH